MPTSRASISGCRCNTRTFGISALSFTHLARPIDPRYRSNLAILVIAAASAVVLFSVSTDEGISAALNIAWRAGVATIGVWALARELDPDVSNAAAASSLLSIPVWMLLGVPDLLATFAMVIAGRVLIRSSGHPPRALDALMVVGLGVFAGRTGPGWILGLTLAFAMSRDRTLDGEKSRFARVGALLIAAGTTGMAVRSGDLTQGLTTLIPVSSSSLITIVAWSLFGLGALAAISTPPYHPVSVGDISKHPLSPRRLQSARRITLVGAILTVLVTREAGILATAPLWVAWIGIAIMARTDHSDDPTAT